MVHIDITNVDFAALAYHMAEFVVLAVPVLAIAVLLHLGAVYTWRRLRKMLTASLPRSMRAALSRRLWNADTINLTEKRATQVRTWRVHERYTWRAVAQAAYEAWPRAWWWPPSNQLAGMDLCRRAAEQLGEDCAEEPWN